ncbi:MAG: DHA2 family efflux MFS transporter permease subunit [Alicyclobacillus sp.]|nr:DHA2 family efflux MFS transporter permease subunit [Alicyclobacillus sp.]
MRSSDPPHNTPAGVNPWMVLSATGLAVVLVMVNLGALNVALPSISRHFHAGAAVANWILLSFMLVNTVLILVFGQFADSFGRRNMYLLGIAVFTVVSLAIGFSPNIWWFLVFRVLQAAGGALVITNNTALLTDAFPESSLGKGLGLNVLIASAAQLIGPVVGGALAGSLGWQWVFWACVPVGLIAMVWGVLVLRRLPSTGSGRPIDWTGGGIIFVALSALIYALSEGGTLGWFNPSVLIGFALFVVLAPILVLTERRSPAPMFDFSLFRDRPYAMANVATFLNAFARVSVVLLASLFYQSVLHQGAFQAGYEVLPVTVGMLVASPIAGALSGRFTPRVLSTTGLGLSALGLILLMWALQPGLAYWLAGTGMTLVGFGSGLFLTPNTRSIMTSVPVDRRGFANGLRSMLQNMGQVLSTAASLTIITAGLPQRLQDAVYSGNVTNFTRTDVLRMVGGYRWAMAALLVATVIGMACSALRGKVAPALQKAD